ncbi:histidine phosphatase family protein [Maricaulis sp. CAU 1757]
MKHLAALAGLAMLAACGASPATDFDRPELLALADPASHGMLERADRHILVVRHARKVAPDCNALDCELSPTGEAMVARLGGQLGAAPFDRALSSSACRTLLTAGAAGVAVQQHQAGRGVTEGCQMDAAVTRTRGEAMAEALDHTARWTLVAEHSNTVCAWIVAAAGESGLAASGCEDGRLASDAYGDIFWLARHEDEWQLVVLEDAFDIMPPEPVVEVPPTLIEDGTAQSEAEVEAEPRADEPALDGQ